MLTVRPFFFFAIALSSATHLAMTADNRAVNAPKGLTEVSTASRQAFSAAGPIKMDQGEINGAKFSIARPASWNHHLLLLAHGYRPETAPLVADLFVQHLAYKTLLSEGWMVAKTSYRRNGLLVADGIADLDALRAHIAETYGVPKRVILEGESMGGLIVALMAERTNAVDHAGEPLYAGAIAIGAALSAKEADMKVSLNLTPRFPLIFLTNQSELEGPLNYVSTRLTTDAQVVPPTLFRVSRNGHVNVNQSERLVALRALDLWLDKGVTSLPRPSAGQTFFDATQPPQPQPSKVVFESNHGGFMAKANEVSEIYGNVQLEAQVSDFAAAGINPNTWFQLQVGEQKFRVRYGKDFEDVKRGEWVLFPNADGYVWLSRNFANAASTAGIKLGDVVTLRRFPNP